jgi:tetratricopeptide (TPR) repeat protein
MKILLYSACFFLTSLFAYGQNEWQQFKLLSEKEDTLGQRILLENWEKRSLNDPELYVAYFNYFVEKSRSEVLVIGQDLKQNAYMVLEIENQDSSKQDRVEYMYRQVSFQEFYTQKAIEWIDKGIDRFPNRLDMRFGKIYFLGLLENYEAFTEQIIQTVDYSAINQNQWLWTENCVLEQPKEMMLGSIQDYQNDLYATSQDTLLYNMQKIAEAVLKVYPDHIESLSNIGAVYFLLGQYEKALTPLLTAYQLNPKDLVVINNIAEIYNELGLNIKAEAYYRLMMKYGDKQDKKYAKEKIKELKSN